MSDPEALTELPWGMRQRVYADDPFKAMVRDYDRRVLAKGGTSIFGKPYSVERTPGIIGRPPDTLTKSVPLSADDYRDYMARRKARSERQAEVNRRRFHEPAGPKPGRIVAGLTGKLGGWADEMP